MTGRARRLPTAALAMSLLLSLSAGAAGSGLTVTVQDGYQADYGVTIPFTRSPRTTDYTFSLYEGGSAAGSPVVTAEVEMTAAQGEVYLPFAYDVTGPQSYTLKIEAHPLASRVGTDRAAAREFSFTTKPTCGCAPGTAGAYYRGSGSAADPFYAGAQQQLAHLDTHRTANIYQDRDIALSGSWPPIAVFSGDYDGGGYEITGLKVTAAKYAGLISELNGGSVHDLRAEGSVAGSTSIGVIAGRSVGGKISRCLAVGELAHTGGFDWPAIGGMVGEGVESVTIEDCGFLGTIRSTQATSANNAVRWNGGIAGVARYASTIRRCYGYVEYSVSENPYIKLPNAVGGIAGDTVGGISSQSNYWYAGTGAPTYGIANTANNVGGPPSNAGCTRITSFSALPSGFDPTVWEMGSIIIPTLSGSSKTVAAPVLKVFQP